MIKKARSFGIRKILHVEEGANTPAPLRRDIITWRVIFLAIQRPMKFWWERRDSNPQGLAAASS